MKQVELDEGKGPVCQRCGGVMRLIGSERHPTETKIDLLTYCCPACNEFLVLPHEGEKFVANGSFGRAATI